jgi:hypothetical protein
MEHGDNQNPTHEHEGVENPNPPQTPNINTQIDEGLTTLRSIVHELRGTR